MILAFAIALAVRETSLDVKVNYTFTGDLSTLLKGISRKSGVLLHGQRPKALGNMQPGT